MDIIILEVYYLYKDVISRKNSHCLYPNFFTGAKNQTKILLFRPNKCEKQPTQQLKQQLMQHLVTLAMLVTLGHFGHSD